MTIETQAPVTISYNDLLERPESLKGDIERALGSEAGCLGVILVKGGSYPLSLRFVEQDGFYQLTDSSGIADTWQTCRATFLNCARTSSNKLPALPRLTRTSWPGSNHPAQATVSAGAMARKS